LITDNFKKEKYLKKDKLLISPLGKKIKKFYLDSTFLEWLAGLTDAEGNFNISLRNLNNNKFNSVIFTFQIGLHIENINFLKNIKLKLNCGHISISGSRCNYFVNDLNSLIQVILPIFNFVKLNSSKYYQFITFEKAIKFRNLKNHLDQGGQLEMIKYYQDIKISRIELIRNNISLTDY
jgi:hypothetical protein